MIRLPEEKNHFGITDTKMSESNIATNSKRIVKNTMALYIRMLLIMGVTLYTSRVILNTLGVEDYGIYNVVGGVVVMLGFLNNSLSGASSRFITFALGKGNKKELQEIFSAVLCVHFILAGLFALFGETAGLWFVCRKLVIPEGRMAAALWVYHCSILMTMVSIISAPYNSLIIAYEKMSAFAYISIVEAVLKLIVAWLLLFISYDKLVVYAILLLAVQVLIRLAYGRYCHTHFTDIRSKVEWHAPLVKKISVYAGWTVNGSLALVGCTQGINVLLNVFFGPAVNAARGVAVQVQTAVMTFVQNFQTAIRPQIVKSYAAGDLIYMHELIINSSKYGFFLLLLLAFPVMLGVNAILRIWLGIVPEHTANFVRIMLFVCMFEPIRRPLINAVHATGDIKKFQIYESSALLCVVPVAYVLLKFFDITPEQVMWVYFIISLLTQGIRMWIVLPKVKIKYSVYMHQVILPLFLPLLCMLVPLFIFSVPENTTLWKLIQYSLYSVIYMAVCVFIFGTTRREKTILTGFIKERIRSVTQWKPKK